VRIEVNLHPSGVDRSVELPSSARGLDLLTALDLAPDAHILLRAETPLPEDEALLEGDRIRVVAVVSGG
jgi:sulfur carrier protein ThiS